MKKTLLTILTLLIISTAFTKPVTASNEIKTEEIEKSITVYVTISKGEILLNRQKILLTDKDSDEKLTVNDALISAHEQYYASGITNGYGYEMGEYGLYITKLWGIDNGGAYGYCVNNTPAMSLSDILSDGDEIHAYAYSDTTAFSDMYTYFNIADCTVTKDKSDEEVTITMYSISYNEIWETVKTPVSGAVIYINGMKTDIITDEHGNFSVDNKEPGLYLVTAELEGTVIIPPLCTVTVSEGIPSTGDDGIISAVILLTLGVLLFCNIKKH